MIPIKEASIPTERSHTGEERQMAADQREYRAAKQRQAACESVRRVARYGGDL